MSKKSKKNTKTLSHGASIEFKYANGEVLLSICGRQDFLFGGACEILKRLVLEEKESGRFEPQKYLEIVCDTVLKEIEA